MRFPSEDDWEETAPAENLPMLEDGRHKVTIGYVRAGTAEWAQNATNPDGDLLNLGLDAAGHERVWVKIPTDWRGKVASLCIAAGVPRPQGGEEWDEMQLKGRTMEIEATRAIARNGREYVRVSRFYDPARDDQPAPPPKPPRSAAVNREAVAHLAPDDIPF